MIEEDEEEARWWPLEEVYEALELLTLRQRQRVRIFAYMKGYPTPEDIRTYMGIMDWDFYDLLRASYL